MSHIRLVQKKIFIFSLVLFCSVSLLFSTACYGEESLRDLHARLDTYLKTPMKRALVLRNNLKSINNAEKTLATGFGVPMSHIYEHKAAISKAIAEYYQLDRIESHVAKTKTINLMQKGTAEILSGKHFTTEDFITLLKAKHAYHKTLSAYENDLHLKQEAYNLAEQALKKAEIAYRQLSEKLGKKVYASWDRDKFELSRLRAEIEAQSTNMAICKLYLNLFKGTLQSFHEEYADLNLAVHKCITNSTKLIIQNNFLDSEIEQNIAWCWTEYSRLSEERHSTENIHIASPTLATIVARLAEFEDTDTILLLSLSENWSYLLRNWYYLIDIIKDVLPINKTEQLDQNTKLALNFINQSRQTATAQMRSLKTVREVILTLDASQLQSNDRQLLTSLKIKISKMLARVDAYLMQLEDMENQTQIISETSNELINKTDKKVLYFDIICSKINSFFTTEIFTVEEHPITIAKLLTAIVLLLLCHLISKRLSRQIKNHFSTDTDKNIASLQKLTSITIWFFAILLILWQLKIPITAFAFVGGYGAIAIGIGMQRIFGNMIAGIILLVQKRIRIGDILTIEGKRGIVKEITLMNTILSCSLASEHVVIPNAKLLDISVLNHTLQDNFIRSSIAFWVTGEKDVEIIKSVIEEVIEKDDVVIIKSHPYFIRVADFGANDSVKFEISYFFDVRKFLVKDSEAILREKVFTELRDRGIKVRDQDTVIQMVKES